jgi:hypothetical protein
LKVPTPPLSQYAGSVVRGYVENCALAVEANAINITAENRILFILSPEIVLRPERVVR